MPIILTFTDRAVEAGDFVWTNGILVGVALERADAGAEVSTQTNGRAIVPVVTAPEPTLRVSDEAHATIERLAREIAEGREAVVVPEGWTVTTFTDTRPAIPDLDLSTIIDASCDLSFESLDTAERGPGGFARPRVEEAWHLSVRGSDVTTGEVRLLGRRMLVHSMTISAAVDDLVRSSLELRPIEPEPTGWREALARSVGHTFATVRANYPTAPPIDVTSIREPNDDNVFVRGLRDATFEMTFPMGRFRIDDPAPATPRRRPDPEPVPLRPTGRRFDPDEV